MADETYLQQNAIDEDELDLTLGLPVRPLNYSYLPCEARYSQNVVETSNGQITGKREQQGIRRHETRVKRDLKRKASLCFNPQNGIVIEENREENCGKVVKLGFQLMGGNAGSFQAYKGYNGHSGGENRASVSSGGNSSGVSDNYQSNSAAGGNSSDSSSHSSHPHMDFSASDSKQTASSEQEPTPLNTRRQCSKSPETNPSPKEGQVVTGQPPKANCQSGLVAQMPRVTTTGNGPQGKTITGFLYKYTKMEVSIVCVCHGASFSPAGFVKHAGGVDVEHPLKHIRISPFSPS